MKICAKIIPVPLIQRRTSARPAGPEALIVKQLIRQMKLIMILLTLALVQAGATGYSQKVTIREKNAPVEAVFRAIEKQTGYVFFYNNADLINAKVNINLKGVSLTEALDRCFAELPLTYKIIGNTIAIKREAKAVSRPDEAFYAVPLPAPSVSSPSGAGSPSPLVREHLPVTKPSFQRISGKVTDEKGEGLPGVSILIKGTQQGTTTDADGVFFLNITEENAVLIFSFVGYVSQEIAVGNRTEFNISLVADNKTLDELVVVGYGTMKKSDLTGSVARVKGEDFKTQAMNQVTEMLTGTVAGFNANQGTYAAGGSSTEIRGPKSLSAGTNPLIVLDGAVFKGSLRDINPSDIQTLDILKDASAAAVYGSNGASGVILITTNKGRDGKPVINFSTKLGVTSNYNQRRGLGPDEYIRYRQDHLRQINPTQNPAFYSNPGNLPSDVPLDQWRSMSPTPLQDNTLEWLSRLRFFPEERDNYLAGKTMDIYDEVFRNGVRQDYDVSVSGGTERASYYWSVGYNNIEGIRVGDQFSSIRSRLNVDFKITDWLNVGMNSQFTDRNEGTIPAGSFYAVSPYGEMYDDKGNLKRLPHGHTDNPLLAYHRTDLLDKTNSLFANMYAEISLPFGIRFKSSFQPQYQARKYYRFVKISEKLGGLPNETPSGAREESSSMNWMLDNILSWKKDLGAHSLDVTLLANVESNQSWITTQGNQSFSPNQELSYHGLQFGDSPNILNNDSRSTGDGLMARVNYSLMSKYMLTASVRRDGYSAFGAENPRATFPSVAVAWVVSEEDFFKSNAINRLKMRLSWGANGNRNIGIYSSLAQVNSSLWYDGSNVRVGTYTTTLSNRSLRWERTTSLNAGLDISLFDHRVEVTADAYDMNTTDLLMNRVLPRITGFTSLMSNLGELGNRGLEISVNTVNVRTPDVLWKSNFVFSLNRNKIKKLFGDYGTYTLLGKQVTGEIPDFSNQWFPGRALDVIWDYDISGIWQTGEEALAAEYNLQPGDFKAVDVDGDKRYVDLLDKQFIGFENPRYRLGLRNDVHFLKRFTASLFVRADLGHSGAYGDGLNVSWDQNDRRNRWTGPIPYWTADRPNNEYPRLNTYLAAFGGGIMVYKPKSFVRIQDVSLSYDLPSDFLQRYRINHMQVFTSVRNLATFTKWPGWDPESGMDPMPRTFTFGLNISL